MGATPVLNPYGGGVGTSGSFNMPGMSNSGMNPPGGSSMNPAGLLGGSNSASGVPMANGKATSSTGGGGPISGTPVAAPPTTAIPGAPAPVTGIQPTATGENGQTITNNTQTQTQTNRTLGELQNYYGEGIGSYIFNLMNTGGINENVANQTNTADINAMQGNIEQGSADLNATLGAQGVSGNSSASALSNARYNQGATAQENQVINQNYMQEYTEGQQMLQSLLPGILNTNAQGTANSNNIFGDLASAIGLGSSGTSLYSSLSDIIPGLG